MASAHRARRLVLRANRVGSERGTEAMRSTEASAQAAVQSGLRCRRSSPGLGCRRAQRRAGCTRSGRSRASRRSRGCQARRTRCRRLVQGADTHLRHPSATAQTGHAGPLTLGVLEALVAALLQRLFTAAPLPGHRKAAPLLGVRHALVVRSADPVDGGCHALVPAVSAVHVVDVHAADLCQHASGSPREGKQERDCSRRARRNRDRITLT